MSLAHCIMRTTTSPKSEVILWLLLLLAHSGFIYKQTDAANVRFRDDAKDVYLLRPPTLDRRFSGSNPVDEDGSLERDDSRIRASSSRPRHDNPHKTDFASPTPLDHESEVQSFLVLKLPAAYMSKSRPAGAHASHQDTNPNSIKVAKFSVAAGGFEAEGELNGDAVPSAIATGAISDTFDGSSSSDHAFSFHQSIEHEFTARILTFRVGRERPVVRVLIWRKSISGTAGRGSSHPCVDVYAFHPRANEVIAGHCPTSSEHWPSGVCLIDLLLPLKWWSSIPAKGGGAHYDATESGRGIDRFPKVKIGFSAYSSSAKAVQAGAPSSDSATNYCRFGPPASGNKAAYILSAEAQRSLRIFGEVELIYPSEYALLPLNHIVKVLVPTIDYYPGTTFTVPIFIHYEPPKLNNSSIYLLQLRARASGHLRIVGVEDIDPDWTISFNIENSGMMVTSTASHRSVSLNESWAGEVFVLIVRIERDTSSANLNNQRPSKGATVSAQLVWSVRLVVDNAQAAFGDEGATSWDLIPDDPSFTIPISSTRTPNRGNADKSSPSTFESHRPGKHAGETVSTHVNVQPDRIDTLAVIGDDEVVNTAVLNGQQVTIRIRVISISQGGVIDDVTPKCHCVSIDTSSLKVSAECSYVYVDGTETKSNTNAAIGVQYGSYRTVARYTVWYPEFPIDIWLADPVLHAVTGWTVPAAVTPEATPPPQKPHQFRNRRNNEQLRARLVQRRSKSAMQNGACRQKFQESELKIYARFRANDQTTGGQTYLGGAGRKVQLDLTQLARPFLRVKNGTVAKLVHTKYSTFVEGLAEGRTEIQLKSPVQRHPYGSSVVETANEKVHLRSLYGEVITGLFFHSELKTPYPPIYNLAIYKSSTFFRRYQEGTVSLTLKYSDGHRTNLDALDASHYRLYVATNGSITVFPGTNGRKNHALLPVNHQSNEVDNDGIILLPVKILTTDEHAEGARLNVTLFPPSSCQVMTSPKGTPISTLATVSVPVEYPRQRRNPVLQQDGFQRAAEEATKTVQLEPLVPSQSSDRKPVLVFPTLDEQSSTEHLQEGYGNAPLLASISVSIFAVAGVLFAVCAVREGWVTVKTFARSRCRQWRLFAPLNMNMPPLVFASAHRNRRGAGRRRSSSTCSSTSASLDDEDSPSPGSRRRNRRHGKRRRNSRPKQPECTESSIVSAENEFVWLRPMSLTSSSSTGPTPESVNGAVTMARSLNGDIERHRSLNGDMDRRSNPEKSTFGGRDNAEYVISENELLDCCGSRRGLDGNARGPNVVMSGCASPPVSTISSTSGACLESKDECCIDDDLFTDTDADVSGIDRDNNKIPKCSGGPICYRPERKMSEVIQGYQRGSYLLHEGATTLPSGWSGSEDYGSTGSPACSRHDKHCPNHIRNQHNRHGNHQNYHLHGHQHNCNSAADSFVQRLLSARSDPTVHIRPTPTTAEAAAAAVEAAKKQCKNQMASRYFDQLSQDQVTPLRNGHQQRRPQSFFGTQFRNSVCSAASSGGTSSDLYWDSSTLGMNEAELRDYFNCLRESVT